jgi:hypothetical protein
MSDPLVVLAQLADGRSAVSVDRDGEGRVTFLLSGADAALIIGRLQDYASGVYITLLPASQVKPTKGKR